MCTDKLWYLLYATVALMIYQWYSWPFVIFCPPPYTWPYSEALCICDLNVLRGEGRHCCSGWSSLVSETPVKEVVLHLPKGHLRHISYIIVHTVWTSSRAAGELKAKDGALWFIAFTLLCKSVTMLEHVLNQFTTLRINFISIFRTLTDLFIYFIHFRCFVKWC